jgi:prepilin-type N-terminal cleavage/methylation domain-containing protein
MRKALTLIELIFSMVIIGVVFTVVPKIIFVSNKSMELSIKEDALFNAYSLMGSILKLTWDENTLDEGKILNTDSTEYSECNPSDGNRTGGFAGSRNCVDETDSASTIGLEGSDYNDIDDYDGYDENISVGGKNRYRIYVDVNYVDSNYANSSDTQEYKELNVTIEAHSDNKKIKDFKSSFFYYSTNLGHIQIKKEQWK